MWSSSNPHGYQYSSKVSPCLKPSSASLLPPHHSGTSSLSTRISRICPQAHFQPVFFHYTLATPSSHSSLSSCLLCLGSPSLQLLIALLRLRAGITSSGNIPSPCSLLPENKMFVSLCFPHSVTICLCLSPLFQAVISLREETIFTHLCNYPAPKIMTVL